MLRAKGLESEGMSREGTFPWDNNDDYDDIEWQFQARGIGDMPAVWSNENNCYDGDHQIDVKNATNVVATHICNNIQDMKQGDSRHDQWNHIFANVSARVDDPLAVCGNGLPPSEYHIKGEYEHGWTFECINTLNYILTHICKLPKAATWFSFTDNRDLRPNWQ